MRSLRNGIGRSLAPVFALLDQSPSGAIDPQWREKLMAEQEEFARALDAGDQLGAATELADIVYYTAKWYVYYDASRGIGCDNAPHMLGITTRAAQLSLSLDDAIAVCLAKYSLRFANNEAQGGSGKDDVAERAAVAAALGWEAAP